VVSPDGTVPRRTLGGRLEVSAVGYGAMVLTGLYGRTDEDSALRVVRHAVDAGVTLFDTADAGTPEELHREKVAHSRHHDDAA
jgi:aryl-alcohol dehydrogenase-like predicted oxidoreductase